MNIQYNLNISLEAAVPSPLDIAFAAFFAVLIAAFEAFYFDPRFKAQIAAGVPDARRRAYRRSTIGQWVLAAVAVLLWARAGRPWARLGLVPPLDWQLAVGVIVTVAVALMSVRQLRAISRLTAGSREKLRGRLAGVADILPHNDPEYRWFLALSVTAGVCEELLYRGFLTWVLGAYVGVPAALLLVAVGFGLAHAYQGRRGMLKTAAVGLVLGAIVLASGWLVPAMISHALVDIGAGVLGFRVLADEAPAPVVAAAA
jgi:membrane protease YdiL (CAAX protease family)